MGNLSVAYVASAFAKYNKMYFGGNLPTPSFEISHGKSALGDCNYFRKRIRISDYYNRPQRDIDNTIIHEMIHWYIFVNSIKDNGHHGYHFNRIAAEINEKGGWNIARTSSVANCSLSDRAKMKEERLSNKEFYVCVYYSTYNKHYFMFVLAPAKLNEYVDFMERNRMKGFFFFKSNDYKKYSEFPMCRKKIRGSFITEEEYNRIKTETSKKNILAEVWYAKS